MVTFYTTDQIKEMSDAELQQALKEHEINEAICNNMQIALKILINSGYGALANKHFLYFRIENAESITTTGQLVNRWTSERTNDLINKLVCNKDKKNYIVNNDTDSVAGDSIIEVNGEKITIEDYFERNKASLIKDDSFNHNYVASVEGDVTPCVNAANEYVMRPINYVMKHRVKKRMFRITVGGRSVVCTEDHSLVIMRDGKLHNVKPADVVDTDQLVCKI